MGTNRRNFLELAAWGAAAFPALAAAAAYPPEPGGGGFGRQATALPPGDAVAPHDAKDLLPEFRLSLDGLTPRVASGGWAKEMSVRQFPIATGIAAVHAFLDPGGSRELHWHASAAEWAIVIGGRCQTVVIEPSGASEINNFEPGDLWYFARGHGHAIQTIGDQPCHILLAFDDGGFSPDVSAFSITDWLHLTPKDWLAREFDIPRNLFDAFPQGETFIQAGEILRPEEALEAPWPAESTHRFRLLKDRRALRDFDGGTFRVATTNEFPASRTMSGGLLNLAPGALRKLHWHVNASELNYVLKGRAQVALFGSGGRGGVKEFGPGDVAYVPRGFGHAIRNVGDEELEIVEVWDAGALEEIDLAAWARAAPRYLLENNFAGAPREAIGSMKGKRRGDF